MVQISYSQSRYFKSIGAFAVTGQNSVSLQALGHQVKKDKTRTPH